MLLCREVDDIVRLHKPSCVEDEHLADANFIFAACSLVSTEIFRPLLLELEGYALAHNAHRVDGIYDGIHLLAEQIPSLDRHRHLRLLSSTIQVWTSPALLPHALG